MRGVRCYYIFCCFLIVSMISGCSSGPPVRSSSKIAYMEIFIPSHFVTGEEAKNIESRHFTVYIDGRSFAQGLKLRKSSFGGIYTLMHPESGGFFGGRSLSETSIAFQKGWHEVTLTTRREGKEYFLPVRLTGRKSSRIKDEPFEDHVSKMFVADDGPGSQGEYFIQFSLAHTKKKMSKKEIAALEKEDVFGTLAILSQPHAEVYLDGDFIGMSPLEKIKVTEGIHVLELKIFGYKLWRRDLRVIADSHIPLDIVLEKEPYVDKNWQVE